MQFFNPFFKPLFDFAVGFTPDLPFFYFILKILLFSPFAHNCKITKTIALTDLLVFSILVAKKLLEESTPYACDKTP